MNKISPFLRRCLFLLLLALMVGSNSTAQRFDPRIVFESNRNGNWDIYSMDVNGNNLRQLTDHPAFDQYPACSPDGRRIAFASERHGPSDLYVMDSDGGNVVRLTNSNFVEDFPSWSPDGTKIAFASYRVGNWEIYTIDTDGNNLTRLTKNERLDAAPNWSPDGKKIAFYSDPDGRAVSRHIFVMNADGKGIRNLTGNTDLSKCYLPDWSPDGSKIVFYVWHNNIADIYAMTADGKRLAKLTKGEGNSRSPSYSPDGTKIAFTSDREGNRNIYLMDTDGRGAVKLTKTKPGIENRFPSWLSGALAVNPNGKFPIFWGTIKRTGNTW